MRIEERVVIVGAGYAGLWAAKRLSRQRGVRLTVINDRDHFVERVRLHQAATGQSLSRISLTDVFAGTDTEVIIDTMTALYPAERTIELGSRTVGYDRLIFAVGSRASAPADGDQVAVPDGADRTRDRLAALSSGTVAVIGGGLTGLETAAEIAEQRPELSVRLITVDSVDAGLTGAAGRYLRGALDRLGVRLDEGLQVISAEELRADRRPVRSSASTGRTTTTLTCTSTDGPEMITIDADLVVWATGYRAHPYARDAGLAVDDHGRILVDGRLRSISDRRVSAIGDAAAVPTARGELARMSCQTAVPMGYRAGREVARSVAGRRSRPHRPRFVWRTISLGRSDGVVQFTRSDDRPLPVHLRGRTAARFKELVGFTVAWLTTGRRPSPGAAERRPEPTLVPADGEVLRNSAA